MPCCHCIVCTALRVPRAAGGFAGRLERRARTTGGKRGRHGKDRRRETTADPLIELFLYVTEFFSGMGVMAAELGASRLLIATVSTNFPVIAALAACDLRDDPRGGHVRDVPDLFWTASGTRARVFPRRPRPDRNLWRHAWSGGCGSIYKAWEIKKSGATPPGSLSRPRVQGKQPSDCDIQRVIRNDAKN